MKAALRAMAERTQRAKLMRDVVHGALSIVHSGNDSGIVKADQLIADGIFTIPTIIGSLRVIQSRKRLLDILSGDMGELPSAGQHPGHVVQGVKALI